MTGIKRIPEPSSSIVRHAGMPSPLNKTKVNDELEPRPPENGLSKRILLSFPHSLILFSPHPITIPYGRGEADVITGMDPSAGFRILPRCL